MSDMIPQETVDAIRAMQDISVDIFGIDCTLYIPTNKDSVDDNTIYTTSVAYVFESYTTKVSIEWVPNKYRLRKLGIFVEDDTPIIAWFSNRIKDADGFDADVDIKINSYFSIATQFIPREMDTEDFEVIDIMVPSMHDAAATKAYKIAPRRNK